MSTERTPIEPSEIRKGDLIRWENPWKDAVLRAVEYRADMPGIGWANGGHHFLLDRPDPLADFPTDRTVGIVLFADGSYRSGAVLVDAGRDLWVDGERVPSARAPHRFIPGEIVSTAALDALALAYPPGNEGWPGNEAALAFLRTARGDR
ncbi:hypothetical protein GCM10008944_01280 [Cytobacillus oceanisediminis]